MEHHHYETLIKRSLQNCCRKLLRNFGWYAFYKIATIMRITYTVNVSMIREVAATCTGNHRTNNRIFVLKKPWNEMMVGKTL
jgi:hypothetical protein